MSKSTSSTNTQQQQRSNMPPLEIVGLPSPLERDNRKIPRVSTRDFVLLVAVVIPLWLVLVAPLIVFSQVFRLLKNVVSPPPQRPPVDSGMVVDKKDDIKPRKDRTYDIVVLGFTGFTGRLAARHLAKVYGVNQKKVKWAVAGRSKDKCEFTKKSLSQELNMPDLTKIPVIVCDTTDADTLPALVQDTRCVASTTGPFQKYGTSVVEACAKYGTHYVDITAEVGWIKCMMLAFQKDAEATGAKILHCCGHDSVPWDLTVYKLNQLLHEKFQDDLETVKIWDETLVSPSGGTLDTVMEALEGRAMKAPKCKVDPFLQLPPTGEKSTHTTTEALPLFLDPFVDGRWTSPFVMAVVNAKIVRWTHARLQQGAPKLKYRDVLVHIDFMTAFAHSVGPLLSGSLLLSPVTKWLAFQLQLVPKPGQGPSMESMEKDKYLLVTAEGVGVNGNRAESTFYFPQDAGYLETARMLVESGLSLALTEEDSSKDKGGGFYSPAAALGDVLLERLIKHTGAEWNSRVVEKGEDEKKLNQLKEQKAQELIARADDDEKKKL